MATSQQCQLFQTSMACVSAERAHLSQICQTSAKNLKCGLSRLLCIAILLYCAMLLTFVMLSKVVPYKVQEIKGGIQGSSMELAPIENNEEEASVNFDSVMQEENDYFDLLLELLEELKKNLDIWRRAHSKTLINKGIFSSYRREARLAELVRSTTALAVARPPLVISRNRKLSNRFKA